MKTDEIFEKLSMNLPLGLGRAHEQAIAAQIVEEADSCLDIGCGRGAFQWLRGFDAVGCDIYPLNLAIARDKNYYEDVLACDIRALPFKAKSFDVAICVEVIEHLEKKEGLELIKKMEKIARRQVIITTPWGYMPLEERDDNPHLNHLSGWTPAEFEKMGYKVYPFYYPRYPAGRGKIQIIARYLLSPLMYPLARRNPGKYAQDFMAVKIL